MHIGRPLAVRAEPGIDRPTLEGIDGVRKELEQSKLDLCQFTLEVLAGLCIDDQDNNDRPFEVLEEIAQLDRLEKMEKRLPQLSKRQQDDKLLVIDSEYHKMDLLALKMLLCCSLANKATDQQASVATSSPQGGSTTQHPQQHINAKAGRSRKQRRNEAYPYQSRILDSARSILDTFQYIASLDKDDDHSSWTRFFDAYCAAAILTIAFLRRETSEAADLTLIRISLARFSTVSQRSSSCYLAKVAAFRIKALFGEATKLRLATSRKRKLGSDASYSCDIDQAATDTAEKKISRSKVTSAKKRKKGGDDMLPLLEVKRAQLDSVSAAQAPAMPQEVYQSSLGAQVSEHQRFTTQAPYLGMTTEQQFQQPTFEAHGGSVGDSTSASASFDGTLTVTQYQTDWSLQDPGNSIDGLGIPYEWYHPPLVNPDPPMLEIDSWGLPQATVGNENGIFHPVDAYGSNFNTNPVAQLARSATTGDIHESYSQQPQSSVASSLPVTQTGQRFICAAQYFGGMQATQYHDTTAAGHTQGQYGSTMSSQGNDSWTWVQQQQHVNRRNSATAIHTSTNTHEGLHYAQPSQFQPYRVPTTSGAWG